MTSITLIKRLVSMYNNFNNHLKIILYIIRKSKLFALVALIIIFNCLPAYSQNILSGHIQVPKFDGASIREVFEVLKHNHLMLFFYVSKLLDLDNENYVNRNQGLLIDNLVYLIVT